MKRYLFNQVRVLCLVPSPGGEPQEVAAWVWCKTLKYSDLVNAVRESLDDAWQFAELLYHPETLLEMTRVQVPAQEF